MVGRLLSFFACAAAQNPKVTADRAFNGFGTNFEGSPEPLYGSVFLPRKFKVHCLSLQLTCCTPQDYGWYLLCPGVPAS